MPSFNKLYHSLISFNHTFKLSVPPILIYTQRMHNLLRVFHGKAFLVQGHTLSAKSRFGDNSRWMNYHSSLHRCNSKLASYFYTSKLVLPLSALPVVNMKFVLKMIRGIRGIFSNLQCFSTKNSRQICSYFKPERQILNDKTHNFD